MSLHMVENEYPKYQSEFIQVLREPPQLPHDLWVDLYDLVNCKELISRSEITISASIGWHQTTNHKGKLNLNSDSFTWNTKSIKLGKEV
jgi:hypothetical protein